MVLTVPARARGLARRWRRLTKKGKKAILPRTVDKYAAADLPSQRPGRKAGEIACAATDGAEPIGCATLHDWPLSVREENAERRFVNNPGQPTSRSTICPVGESQSGRQCTAGGRSHRNAGPTHSNHTSSMPSVRTRLNAETGAAVDGRY